MQPAVSSKPQSRAIIQRMLHCAHSPVSFNIAFRNWKGESLKTIAPDYDTTEKALIQLRKDNRAEFGHLETEFRNAEIQRLTAGDPIRQAHYGFILAAYMLVRTRTQVPKAIIEFSQQSEKIDPRLHSTAEAEAVLESFEADFGIKFV